MLVVINVPVDTVAAAFALAPTGTACLACNICSCSFTGWYKASIGEQMCPNTRRNDVNRILVVYERACSKSSHTRPEGYRPVDLLYPFYLQHENGSHSVTSEIKIRVRARRVV